MGSGSGSDSWEDESPGLDGALFLDCGPGRGGFLGGVDDGVGFRVEPELEPAWVSKAQDGDEGVVL